MKRLYLLRHAKSDWTTNDGDHDRPLNERGKQDCKKIGLYLKNANIDFVLSSSALRTKQTIERALKAADKDKTLQVQYTKKLYLPSAQEMLKEINNINDNIEDLLVVCHNPGTHQLAALLTKKAKNEDLQKLRVKYPTAALAVFAFDLPSWQHIAPGTGELLEFVIPREL